MSGSELEILVKLVVAGVLGYLVGWEREYVARREAGTRTFSLVSMTSALVTALSLDAFGADSAARIIANVMVGVGFLGGGMILKDPGRIRGLTTAPSATRHSYWSISSERRWLQLADLSTAAREWVWT
jgi:putative Mg2+ transporter-C (MgtC) family protein